MLVETLSIQQPFATLVCAGIKTVENRTWSTNYRGRLLIHASKKYDYDFLPVDLLPKPVFKKLDKYMNERCELAENAPKVVKDIYNLDIKTFQHYELVPFSEVPLLPDFGKVVNKYGAFFKGAAIVGECELFDIITNSKDDFAEAGCYHWILKNPILYDHPIINVLGKLKMWKFDID